jgi:hypothetical protein
MSEQLPTASLRIRGGLAWALAVVVCGAAAVALDAPQPLRALAAGGLVLWAPGYALTTVLIPPGAITGVERALLAFATSLALTAIPAILAEAVGVRLGVATFLITACAITSVAAALAFRRLRSFVDLPAPARASRPPQASVATAIAIGLQRLPRPPLAPVATAIGIGLVLAGGVVAASIPPQPAGIQGSSTLAVTSAGRGSFRAQVISAELDPTSYRLTMVTGTLRPGGGGATGRSDRVELARFTLRPGDTWQLTVVRPLRSEAVMLLLYRGGEKRQYRRVLLPRPPV